MKKRKPPKKTNHWLNDLIGLELYLIADFARRNPATVKWIVVFSIIVTTLGFLRYRVVLKEKYLARFYPELAEYTSYSGLQFTGSRPHIRGKIVIIERNIHINKQTKENIVTKYQVKVKSSEHRISDLMNDLPKELQPCHSAEVTTVVWLDYSLKHEGGYMDGSGAERWVCGVTIIDTSIPSIIGKRFFKGGDPPSSKIDDGKRILQGKKPDDEIVEYLKKLPRY